MEHLWRAIRKRWCAILVWTVLAIAALATSAALYLSTAAGHRELAHVLERLISTQIRGEMTIGRLERIGFFRPILRDLEFFHPNGTRVLTIDRGELDVDASDLLKGELGSSRASVTGGELRLALDSDGRLNLEEALCPPKPTSADSDSDTGFPYRIRQMHVQALTVTLQTGSGASVQLRGVRGFVAVARGARQQVRVQLDQIEGDVDASFLGAPVRLLRGDGFVHGCDRLVARLHLQMGIGDDDLEAQVSYSDRAKPPLELALQTHGIKSRLTAFGAKLGSFATAAVRVDWR